MAIVSHGGKRPSRGIKARLKVYCRPPESKARYSLLSAIIQHALTQVQASSCSRSAKRSKKTRNAQICQYLLTQRLLSWFMSCFMSSHLFGHIGQHMLTDPYRVVCRLYGLPPKLARIHVSNTVFPFHLIWASQQPPEDIELGRRGATELERDGRTFMCGMPLPFKGKAQNTPSCMLFLKSGAAPQICLDSAHGQEQPLYSFLTWTGDVEAYAGSRTSRQS